MYTNIESEGYVHPVNQFKVNILIDIDNAKNLKGKKLLSALFIGKLGTPDNFQGFNMKEPTFDNPKEVLKTDYYISMNVDEIWIYNFKTGEILTKIKAFKKEDFSIYSLVNSIILNTDNLETMNGKIRLSNLETKLYKNNLHISFEIYNSKQGNQKDLKLNINLENSEKNVSNKNCVINIPDMLARENKKVSCLIENIDNISSIDKILVTNANQNDNVNIDDSIDIKLKSTK